MRKPRAKNVIPPEGERCQAHFWRGSFQFRCTFRAVKDGYCGKHHPNKEAVKAELKAKKEAAKKTPKKPKMSLKEALAWIDYLQTQNNTLKQENSKLMEKVEKLNDLLNHYAECAQKNLD